MRSEFAGEQHDATCTHLLRHELQRLDLNPRAQYFAATGRVPSVLIAPHDLWSPADVVRAFREFWQQPAVEQVVLTWRQAGLLGE